MRVAHNLAVRVSCELGGSSLQHEEGAGSTCSLIGVPPLPALQ